MEEKPTGCVVMWVCWKLGWRGGLGTVMGTVMGKGCRGWGGGMCVWCVHVGYVGCVYGGWG